jgi:hypothetical protein
MEALNLQSHTPDEFVGKTITVDGRSYRIGPSFRVSDQGYAHYLTNEMSGLCLHILQIRPEYMSDPASTREVSKTKAQLTEKLRSQMRRESKTVEIPIINVVDANGGSFELHETSWGAFGFPEEPLGGASIDKAMSLADAEDYQSAIAELENLLVQHPHHTVALNNMGFCYGRLDNNPAALETLARAIEIEPNFAAYRGNQFLFALNCPRYRQGLMLFQQLKTKYPFLEDYDGYAIQAYLTCGTPKEALELVQQSTLPETQAEELLASITAAVEAKEQFTTLYPPGEGMFADGYPEGKEAVKELEALHARYDADPFIQANLGFALRSIGQYRRAAQLLMSATGGISDELVKVCWAKTKGRSPGSAGEAVTV